MLTLSVQQYWPGMLLGGLFFPSAVYVCAYMRLKVSTWYPAKVSSLTLCLILTFWILAALFYMFFNPDWACVMLLSILVPTIFVLIHHINSILSTSISRTLCHSEPSTVRGFAFEIEQSSGRSFFCGFILEKKAAMDFAQNDEMPVLSTEAVRIYHQRPRNFQNSLQY